MMMMMMMGDDGRSKSRRSEVLAMRLLAFHVTVAAFFVSVAAVRPASVSSEDMELDGLRP